ncbi:hypothetical protein J5Y03_00580 [Bacillus sp. RG28]|uniref:Uncharacterized protein n=1 Tax=Gottfriedia endophytica TaxID=2820819 RepID=A0A940SF75_9BACI|nr:hypothetical protein [Gottfriedia endophytica]MBP0723677.1 hypothetical protein [Gottfriedia endophytica]
MFKRRSKEEVSKLKRTNPTGSELKKSLSKDLRKAEDALRMLRGGIPKRK